MKKILTTIALLCFSVNTAADHEAVIEEIHNAVSNYYYGFSNFDPTKIANELYSAPFSVVAEGGNHTVLHTTEEVVDFITNFLSNLRANQWHYSDMPTYEICILGPNIVFVSGTYIRYKADGEEISRSGSTYLYQKKPEGWKILSIINKTQNVSIQCQYDSNY